MKKMNNNVEKAISIIFTISALLVSFAPYQTDSTLSLHTNLFCNIIKITLYALSILNATLIILPYFRGKKIKISNLLILIPIVLYFIFSSFYTYDMSINISGVLTLIQLILFALSDDSIKKRTFVYIKNSLFIICAIGIVCYLNYLLKMIIPYNISSYYVQNINSRYVDYKISFLYLDISKNFIRLCGSFNEPGFLGTVCALALCIDNLDLKNKQNIIILIACILTFSLASIMLLLVYLILKYLKNIKTLIIAFAILIIYFNVLPNITTGNANIDNLIQRMTITEKGLAGDNRNGEDLDIIFKQTLENKLLFGYGYGYLQNKKLSSFSTYKTYIIQYGIVGCLFLWGTLLIISIKMSKKNINSIFFILIFFISIYQRPNIFILIYQVLLFGGVLYINDNKNNEKRGVIKL